MIAPSRWTQDRSRPSRSNFVARDNHRFNRSYPETGDASENTPSPTIFWGEMAVEFLNLIFGRSNPIGSSTTLNLRLRCLVRRGHLGRGSSSSSNRRDFGLPRTTSTMFGPSQVIWGLDLIHQDAPRVIHASSSCLESKMPPAACLSHDNS